MNPDLKAFLLDQATKWAVSVKNLKDPVATIDDDATADTYGECVLAWEVTITSSDLPAPITVEVAIDSDGYAGAGLLANPRGSSRKD